MRASKCLILLALLLCFLDLILVPAVAHDNDALDDPAIINFINSHPNNTWTAGKNARFAGMKVNDVKCLLGVLRQPTPVNGGRFKAQQGSCYGVNCGSLPCCAGACYNPSIYSCDNGLLCPAGQKACGAVNYACYNPSIFTCMNGNLVAREANPSPSPNPSPTPISSDCPTQSSSPEPVPSPSPAPPPSPSPSASIPTTFDASQKWPNCIHGIRNQGECGSCWAFSSSEVLSDRFCISTNGSVNVVLSPQYQIDCDTRESGCSGGYLTYTWDFLANVGTPLDSCVPYVNKDTTATFPCPSSCIDGSPISTYRARADTIHYYTSPSQIAQIQQNIMTDGPMQAAMDVYTDFFYYQSGVYTHLYGNFVGGHAVKLVGWGVDSSSGLPYWIAYNQWGTNWGMKGVFWIERGVNECNIESLVIAGNPL
jgi:cathepsin B